MTLSLNFPGAIQPTRYPGANVFDTEPLQRTKPSSSNALQGLGRLLPKYTSPYKSSSMSGMPRSASIFTISLLWLSGIQLPNGLLKLEIRIHPFILDKSFFNASGSTPYTGCVGSSIPFSPQLFASCNVPK